MRAALAAAVVALLIAPAVASGAPSLVEVGRGFATPVHVAGPPGDGSRLFVVEKPGRVQVLVNGQRQPFLDITGAVNDSGSEQGLLSIAFAPDYATSGLFYVFYTGGTTGPGPLIVAEGRRSAADPNRGAIEREVFSVPHPSAQNHNGGQLAFGPDGLLYVSTGDGGSTPQTAQQTTSNLGKILRLDPRTSSTPAIFALGLRNPWRFSFDRGTGTMIIGDVGQDTNEEIDVVPATGGNFGWNPCEGTTPSPCSVPGAVAPALNLPQSAGYSAVVGGFVVRDPGLPTLVGRYVFGDQSKDSVLSAVLGVDTAPRPESLPVVAATSFGEDGCGHVYVAAFDGVVSRIQDGAVSPCPAGGPAVPGAPAPGGATPVAAGCGLKVRAPRIQRAGRVRLRLRARGACTVTLRSRGFRVRRVALQAGVARTVRITPSRKRLRRLERGDRVERVRIRVRTRSASGGRGAQRVAARIR